MAQHMRAVMRHYLAFTLFVSVAGCGETGNDLPQAGNSTAGTQAGRVATGGTGGAGGTAGTDMVMPMMTGGIPQAGRMNSVAGVAASGGAGAMAQAGEPVSGMMSVGGDIAAGTLVEETSILGACQVDK